VPKLNRKIALKTSNNINKLLSLTKGHRQVATISECCSASDHRYPETRAWTFMARKLC